MTEADRPALAQRPSEESWFDMLAPAEAADAAAPLVHKLRNGHRCATDSRGHETPRRGGRDRLVVDSSEGFVPLWAPNTTLRWRFQERSMRYFRNPEAAKAAIEQLMNEAVVAWGDAVPVKFTRNDDLWDFEVSMSASDDCDGGGCVLASAFFPDSGRHRLRLYPKLFAQPRAEQIETLTHEFGHIFGLRHFFANISEREWPSEIFGEHVRFTIMNYGAESQLTEMDRADLKKLYRAAWSGKLEKINSTPIRFVSPFHETASRRPVDTILEIPTTRKGTTGLPQERDAAYASTTGSFDPIESPSAESLRALASQLHSMSPAQVSAATMPFSFLGGAEALRGAPVAARTNGKFMGEAKWWNAGYSRCEILIETDGGRFYFRGEGGGFPGAGAYSGDLYTGDIARLIGSTTTCQIVSALFYVNITFWSANSENLGMFHGGGFGVGGGLLAGRWKFDR